VGVAYHVTRTIFGSTVGYPSDSLASCFIYDSKKSQDCMAKSPNPKLTPKFPRSWEKSQAVGALTIEEVICVEEKERSDWSKIC